MQNLMVEGRSYTDPETIKAIVNVEKNSPLFSLKPSEARKMLEKLSWVKSAQVERRLPDTLYIRLEERQPFALWQRNKRLSLIDREGVVLTDHKLRRFDDLIIIIGDKAPENAVELLGLLQAEPSVKERVEVASFVSDRRWDLRLDDGKLVKLPEKEIGVALRKLALKHEQEALLDKAVTSIDLRQSDRITVGVDPGVSEGRSDNLKPTSHKAGAI